MIYQYKQKCKRMNQQPAPGLCSPQFSLSGSFCTWSSIISLNLKFLLLGLCGAIHAYKWLTHWYKTISKAKEQNIVKTTLSRVCLQELRVWSSLLKGPVCKIVGYCVSFTTHQIPTLWAGIPGTTVFDRLGMRLHNHLTGGTFKKSVACSKTPTFLNYFSLITWASPYYLIHLSTCSLHSPNMCSPSI